MLLSNHKYFVQVGSGRSPRSLCQRSLRVLWDQRVPSESLVHARPRGEGEWGHHALLTLTCHLVYTSCTIKNKIVLILPLAFIYFPHRVFYSTVFHGVFMYQSFSVARDYCAPQ